MSANFIICTCGKQLATIWQLHEHRRTEHGVPYTTTEREPHQEGGMTSVREMSGTRLIGIAPGRISAVLIVTCAICKDVTPVIGQTLRNAGAHVKALGWRVDRLNGGYVCPGCDAQLADYIEALRMDRDGAAEQLRVWREQNKRKVTA